jgi:PAS domain S-box-containing protein
MATNVECTNFSACLFQKSLTGAMILSEKGDIIQVNDAFSVMLDLENSDTLSRSFHDFLSSDHKKLFISQYKEFFKHPEGKSFELVLEGRKGKKVDVQITGVKTEDNQGNSTIKEALLINATNITQLKQTQNDLATKKEELQQLLQRVQESEETYRNLFQNAQVGLFRTRICDGKMMESNEQLAKMFGYDNRLDFLSEYLTSENYVDEGTREKMLKMIKEDGFIQNYEVRFYRKDQSIFWARYSARIYTDKGWIEGVAEDITGQKKTQRALRENEQRFQKMLSVVPDMISIQSPDMDILYSNWQGFAAAPKDKQKLHTKCYKTYRNFDNFCPDCLAKTVLETRKPFRKEARLPDGTWQDIRVIPFLDEDNNVEMFME